MQPEETILLLSIKPRFAEAILDGTKTVELRRVQPSVHAGTIVLLYASSPQRELVGTFRVAGLEVDSISAIWDRYGSECGVSEAEFIDYFAGANQAVAILVDSPVRLSSPQSLEILRDRMVGFHPPQSFRYFNRPAVEKLGLSY